MQTEIKSNFEKLLDDGSFSNSQKEIKEKNFNKFLEQGFPNKRIEDWKFSDLNQIISTNFENLAFSKKDNQSSFDISFINEFDHNKIVFVDGKISKVDFSYENEDKISLEKDVDGVTCLGFGNMAMGLDAYGSCTPAGIIRLIDSYNLDVEGLNAVVVGRSPILGKPMAMMLLNKNATVTICHSRTRNIESIISEADLIVGAVGIPKFIQKNWIKNDCIVIDAGYHPDKCGDIDLDGVEEIASAFTPVPGGVGPMTINTLILHTLQSAIKTTKD